MSDPLIKLRECHLAGKEYKWDQPRGEIIIDGERIPVLTPTRFLSNTGVPFTIGSLYYVLTTAKSAASEYVIACYNRSI
jgi:hypothetical protein